MEYKAYDEYKDSGVEWIGEIPESWKVITLKYFLMLNESGVWGEDPQNDERTYEVLRSTEITEEGKWNIEDPAKRSITKSDKEKYIIKNSDLLVVKSSGSMDHLGKTVIVNNKISKKEYYFSNFIQRLRVNNNLLAKYLYYMFNNILVKTQFKYLSTTTTGLNNLSAKIFNNLLLPFAPQSEQQKIASFLDEKTEKIDKIISKKETLVEKLEKYKKSVITEAVTKGKIGDKYLNEDGELVDEIEMKDSGVEWIGKIPCYYKETMLKYIVKTTKGYAFKASMFKDSGIPIIKATHIKNNTLVNSDDYISNKHLKEYSQVKLFENDIIMSTVGSKPEIIDSAVGQLAMVPKKYESALLNQNTVIFRLKNNININKNYLFYYLISNMFRKFLDLHAHGTANQASISLKEILNFSLALPNENIQNLIKKLLSKRLKTINKLINQTKKSIDKYKEYKKSLIFEAVTGKIDLRDYNEEGA